MKYVIRLAVFGVCLLALGCSDNKPLSNVVPYYDLSAQLRKQIQVLYREKAYLIKYVTYNGKSDQVINKKPDWNKEFDPLFEIDIHAPALIGLYDVDTMRNADSTVTLNYKANSDDARVIELTILISQNGDLVRFDATSLTGSMLSRSTHRIKYRSYKDYKIEVREENKYSSDAYYSVSGEMHVEDEYFQ